VSSVWIVFAPLADGDEALVNAHWIAQQTAALVPSPTATVMGTTATRAALEAAWMGCEAQVGLCLFGHGDAQAVYGADGEPAFDQDNACGQWVHAFACRTGLRLAHTAAARGVGCYLGYDTSLLVGWSMEALPPPLRALLSALVTAASDAMRQGVRSRRALQRAVSSAADALVDWINQHAPEEHLGLGVLAAMLVDRVVLVGPDAFP
jgi:hypothetical protein